MCRKRGRTRLGPPACARCSVDVHDLIFVGAEPELFAVLDHVLPVRVVMRGVEAVAVVLELQVRDGAVRHDGLEEPADG